MKFVIMVAAVAVSASLLIPTLAHARQQDEAERQQVSATISYNSNDLQTDEGIARFQRRVDGTIRRMCSAGREHLPSLYKDTRQCIADARQSIEPDVQLALASASNR